MSSPSTTPAASAPGDFPSEASREVLWFGLRRATWVQIGIVALLLVALFWPNLRRLWLKTNPINGAEWENWSHTIVVPVIGVYYLLLRSKQLLEAPVRPLLADGTSKSRWLGGAATLLGGLIAWVLFDLEAMSRPPVVGGLAPYISSAGIGLSVLGLLVLGLDWGLGTLMAGLLLAAYGIWPGQNDYLKDVGMVMTLFGVVLTLAGPHVMKIAWFPIVFLFCAIPWPGLVYTKLAIPLQNLAAGLSVIVMNLAQVDAVVEGTRIVIERGSGPARVLNVAEACAGMRSLMTFVTLGAAIAFLSLSRPLWQKLIIIASAVPIAILCNAARVSTVGLLDVYVSEEATRGVTHSYVGLLLLIPAFFLLLGVGWVLDRLFIEVSDEELNAFESEEAGA